MYVMCFLSLKEEVCLVPLIICSLHMAPWMMQINTSYILNLLFRLEFLLLHDTLIRSMQMLFVQVGNCKYLHLLKPYHFWTINNNN